MANNTRFRLYGQWVLGDLDIFVHNLSISYGYFYWLTRRYDRVPTLVKQRFTRAQWGREFANETLPHFLLRSIPELEKPQITAIHLETLGWIEVNVDVHALQGIDLCMGVWSNNQSQALEATQKIITELKEYTQAPREQRNGQGVLSNRDMLPAATQLVQKVAPVLGFTRHECNHILALTGNPLSSLRLIATLAKACQRLAMLQSNHRIELPGLQDRRAPHTFLHDTTYPNLSGRVA